MNRPLPKRSDRTVFTTPWFQILESAPSDGGHPHYRIQSSDFVVIIAKNLDGSLILVRQFRHGVEAMTLELPAGHVDAGQTPEEAARRELLEETGYEAEHLTLVGKLSPSTARFTNRVWCYFAGNCRFVPSPDISREVGVEVLLWRKPLKDLLDEPEFFSATSCGALFAGVARGQIVLG
jgi:8-oxo-dGTP pyrophosphatase MutT (NUDIX family)